MTLQDTVKDCTMLYGDEYTASNVNPEGVGKASNLAQDERKTAAGASGRGKRARRILERSSGVCDFCHHPIPESRPGPKGVAGAVRYCSLNHRRYKLGFQWLGRLRKRLRETA